MLSGQHVARVPRQRLLIAVTVTGSVQVAGVTVEAGGRLAFDPNGSAELTSTRNVVVNGTLSMRPASSSVVQTIRVAGVDAARIVGGGMDPVDSDVGLWVMGAGQLDLAGTPRPRGRGRLAR
jgi:hypothetical protein